MVFIGAIIAVLLLCFVMLIHTHNLFEKKSDVEIALWQQAENQMLLPQAEAGNAGNSDMKKWWGLLRRRSVEVEKGKQRVARTALLGNSYDNPPALIIQDRRRPLVLAGEARIEGDAYIPSTGVRPGSIKGNSYRGDQLIYGLQYAGPLNLKGLGPDLERHTNILQQGIWPKEYSVTEFTPGIESKNSFSEPSQVITSDYMVLDQSVLTGNIILWAADKIVVPASASLQDVILAAPQIVIEDGVMGAFQAIASREITIGERVSLKYPSMLAVIPSEDHSGSAITQRFNVSSSEGPKALLSIGSQSEIKGWVGVLLEEEDNPVRPQIFIQEDALVIGEVFCKGSLEHRGMIYGTAVVGGFMAVENGSIYQNHLYQGNIIQRGLPPGYAGLYTESAKINQSAQEKIVKWLY